MVETPSPGPVLPMTVTRPPHPPLPYAEVNGSQRSPQSIDGGPVSPRMRSCPVTCSLPSSDSVYRLSRRTPTMIRVAASHFSQEPRTTGAPRWSHGRDERVACTGVPRRQGPSPGALAQEGCVILPALTTLDSRTRLGPVTLTERERGWLGILARARRRRARQSTPPCASHSRGPGKLRAGVN